MQYTYDAIDRAALALGGGLITLGVVVLGIVEVIAGPPYGAAPLTNDAGEVLATPLVDPNLRTGLVALGLVVLALWGLYRVTTTRIEAETTETIHTTAD